MTNTKHATLIGIWLVLLPLALSSQGCEPARQPSRYLIPDGYAGWVNIYYGVQDAPALPIEDGHYLVRIPASGSLRTSSRLEGGIANDDYYYVDSQGNRRKLESTGWDKGGTIWAESTGSDSKGMTYEQFFVGTESQLKEYGFKMNKQEGPITEQARPRR